MVARVPRSACQAPFPEAGASRLRPLQPCAGCAGQRGSNPLQGEPQLRSCGPRNVALLGQPGAMPAQEAPVVANRPVLIAQSRGVMLSAPPGLQLVAVGGGREQAMEAGACGLYEEVGLLPVTVEREALVEGHAIKDRLAHQRSRRYERGLDRLTREDVDILHRRPLLPRSGRGDPGQLSLLGVGVDEWRS